MRPHVTLISMGVSISLLTLLPLTILAHTLEAPEFVVAEPDGAFSYQFVFTAGPGSALLGGWQEFGIENVNHGLFADCFCTPVICTFLKGESLTSEVMASLVDPTQQGLVRVDMFFCGDPNLTADTTILPFGGTPVEPTTWGAIKSSFR